MEKKDETTDSETAELKDPEKSATTEETPTETASADSVAVEETPETAEPEEPVEEENNETSRFSKIYSNVASNRYENLRTSYIENKAKELRKKRK